MSNPTTEASLSTRLKVWFDGIPFSSRAIFVACCSVYLVALLIGFDSLGMICLQPQLVVERLQVHRVFTSAVFHVGFLHIFFNMLAFIPIGKTLERQLGSVKFGFLILLIITLGGAMYLSIAYILQLTGIYPKVMLECAVGYSGVVFGLIVIDAHSSGNSHYSIFGFFNVPAKFYAWALLFIWQLLLPGISFFGHLSGLLIGQFYTWGWLKWCMPSENLLAKIERSCLCSCFLNYPSFIMATNAGGPSMQHSTNQSSGGGGGISGIFRNLQGWTRLGTSEQTAFQGQARTVGVGENDGPALPWSNSASTQVHPGPKQKNATAQGAVNLNVAEDLPASPFAGQAQYLTGDASPTAVTSNSANQEVLMEMGFRPEAVQAALRAADGDMDTATQFLTGQR